MLTISVVSGTSSITIGRRNLMPSGPVGNLLHIAAFACLGYALSRALDARGASAGLGAAAGRTALVIAALFGVSDEVHQFFTPGRLCSLYDALLDMAGATFALIVPRTFPIRGCAADGALGLPGQGRPRSPWPSVLCIAVAVVVALVTGRWRLPGDDAIEIALLSLGLSPG